MFLIHFIGTSPISSRRQSRESSFASSPLKTSNPDHISALDATGSEHQSAHQSAADRIAAAAEDSMLNGSLESPERRQRENDISHITSGSPLRMINDPFLRKNIENTTSRMARTTQSWVDRQQLMLRTKNKPTIQEERELENAEHEKMLWFKAQRKRRKVANAAVKMADKYKQEKEQNENEDFQLNQMIQSLPECFRKRVMMQVSKNRQQVNHVVDKMKGTFNTKNKSGK